LDQVFLCWLDYVIFSLSHNVDKLMLQILSCRIRSMVWSCTQIYINLEQAIFNERENSEYTTRIAKTIKGARALLAAGFECITDMEGYKLFRKRK
jgi:hypothetical protein